MPIVEPTDGQQWVPPTLACPFLEQGERSFIERFVKVEVGLNEQREANKRVADGLEDMRKTLRAAVITIICSIVASITIASWKSSHEPAEHPTAAATQGQGVKK